MNTKTRDQGPETRDLKQSGLGVARVAKEVRAHGDSGVFSLWSLVLGLGLEVRP
jgi:hypothetical protein